jgi:DNA-binding transcriptional ArsR family regulator
MAADEVFTALGDPTRREVLALVAQGRAQTATELAAALPVSRQAVAKHLAVLEDARLVDGAREGRTMRFRVTPAPLSDAIEWMAQVGGEWDERLGRLRAAVQERAGG